MGIVAGLDSSSAFTRIIVCDTDTGAVLRQGYAPHPQPAGDPESVHPHETDPQAWLLSLGDDAEEQTRTHKAGSECGESCRHRTTAPQQRVA
ncbi:hypothetical protein ACWDA9_28385, partial [Streptomyces sp. NPDC001193]